MFKIALAQTKHPGNGDTVSLAARMAQSASQAGAVLLVFPECFMTPFEKTPEDFAKSAQTLEGPFAQTMQQIAAQNSLWMVFTMNEKNPAGGQPFNTAVLVDDTGRIQGSYRKTHLYIAHALDESEKMTPGDQLFTPVETPFCTLGLGICYDLRFPEIARKAALTGCELLLFPAAWVKGPSKQLHWNTLLAARAIENEMFVAGCCRADEAYLGHSAVYGPLGETIAAAGTGEELLVADIDITAVQRARANMPIFDHLRPELY